MSGHTPGPWEPGHQAFGLLVMGHEQRGVVCEVRTGNEADQLLIIEAPEQAAKIATLAEALTLLTDGYKYSTDVITIARNALAAAGLPNTGDADDGT